MALLFINSDQDYSTGWYGYDYLINKNVVDESQTTLCRWNGTEWEEVSKLNYAVLVTFWLLSFLMTLGAMGENIELDYKVGDNATELVDLSRSVRLAYVQTDSSTIVSFGKGKGFYAANLNDAAKTAV